MAPAAICELVKRHGHKGFVSIRPIQIEAFCNLCLASTQLALQRGFATAGIAGSIAAAILLVSSVVRLFTAQRKK